MDPEELKPPATRKEWNNQPQAPGKRRKTGSRDRSSLSTPCTPKEKQVVQHQPFFVGDNQNFRTPDTIRRPRKKEETPREVYQTQREKEIIATRVAFPQKVTTTDFRTYSHKLGRKKKTVARWFSAYQDKQEKRPTTNLSFKDFFTITMQKEDDKQPKDSFVGCGVTCRDKFGIYTFRCPSYSCAWHQECLRAALMYRNISVIVGNRCPQPYEEPREENYIYIIIYHYNQGFFLYPPEWPQT